MGGWGRPGSLLHSCTWECSMAESKHPKIPMLPHVTVGYPALHEGGPAGTVVPKPTLPHPTTPTRPHTTSPMPAKALFSLTHSGTPTRMVQCLACLCLPRCDIFWEHICASWGPGAGLGLTREGQLAPRAPAPTTLRPAGAGEGSAAERL